MRMIKKLSTIAILGVITCLCLFSGCSKIPEKVEILQYELGGSGEYYVITGKTDKAPKKLVDEEQEKVKKYLDMKEKCAAQLAELQ